jgi:hypothetical protein
MMAMTADPVTKTVFRMVIVKFRTGALRKCIMRIKFIRYVPLNFVLRCVAPVSFFFELLLFYLPPFLLQHFGISKLDDRDPGLFFFFF